MSTSGEKTARILRLPLNQDEGPLPPARRNGEETAVRRVIGARVVAFLAALLFAFAAWLPWLAVTYHFGQDAQTHTVDGGMLAQVMPILLSSPTIVARGPSREIFLLATICGGVWAGVSGAGTLLAPLLWLRPRPRASRLALSLYSVWLVLATVFTLALARMIFFPPVDRGGGIGIPQWSPRWGMWLALIALVSGAAAVTMLIRYDWSTPRISARSARSPIMRMRAGWVGIVLLTVGILLWGLGFMAIPWATVNCPVTPITLNHFVAGRCAALDSGDALSYFATRSLSRETWNLAGGIYALYGVLIGGGLLVLIALWRTSPSRAICAWATLWLLGASAIAYLAYRGVGVILTVNPVMSAEARGIWVGASGVTTTLLGLLLSWLGIIPMEHAATVTALHPVATEQNAGIPDAPLHLVASERDGDEFEVMSLR